MEFYSKNVYGAVHRLSIECILETVENERRMSDATNRGDDINGCPNEIEYLTKSIESNLKCVPLRNPSRRFSIPLCMLFYECNSRFFLTHRKEKDFEPFDRNLFEFTINCLFNVAKMYMFSIVDKL